VRRYAARKDANQSDVVDALRACGWSVWVQDQPCDLLISKAGLNLLLEIKDGKKRPSARKLTPAQVNFERDWRGQFDVVKSAEEAIEVAEKRLVRFLSRSAL
jgi:hypothetical protein